MYTAEIENKCQLLSLQSIYIVVLIKLQCKGHNIVLTHSIDAAMDWEKKY